jgi:hypothetical protein
MKKMFFLIVILILSFGCSKDNENIFTTQGDKLKEVTQKIVVPISKQSLEPKFQKFNDLSLGVIKEIAKLENIKLEFKEFQDYDEQFVAFERGDVDIIMGVWEVKEGFKLTDHYYIGNIGIMNMVKSISFMVKDQNEEILNALNRGLNSLKHSGKLDELQKLYLGDIQVSSKSNKTTSSNNDVKNNDINTKINDKNGYNWISLTDNQKFHAISNALYNLEKSGFAINEGEYFFIEALDAFYSDNSTRDVPIATAIAQIGVSSGALE